MLRDLLGWDVVLSWWSGACNVVRCATAAVTVVPKKLPLFKSLPRDKNPAQRSSAACCYGV
jgi:hypothetical protein